MDMEVTHEDQVVIVRPTGSIDTRSSFEFEKQLQEVLEDGSRRLVVDCGAIDQLTSAGIRVLLLAAKRLRGEGGSLTLASPNEHVQTVLEISGLADTFPIVESATEAVGRLAAEEERPPSRISVVVLDLFGDSAESGEPAREESPAGDRSELSRHVAGVLDESPESSGDDEQES